MLVTFHLSCSIVRTRHAIPRKLLKRNVGTSSPRNAGDFVSGNHKKKKKQLLGSYSPAINRARKCHCCKMNILGHDKMSSRVVLENDGAAHGKVTDNILLRSPGKRKSRDRETSRPILSSRTLPHSEEKPKNRPGLQQNRPATRKRQNSSGRKHFYPNLNKRDSLSWHLFISA